MSENIHNNSEEDVLAKLKSSETKPLKVAIVHDWLTSRGGAEKVVLAIHELFLNSPIYTSVYLPTVLPEFSKFDVRTTFIQKIPFFRTHHKFAFLLRTLAFAHLDLSGYDLVISSSTAEAKGVKTKNGNKRALHICYCNTPTRYYFSGFEQYLSEPGFGFLDPIARLMLKIFIKPLRQLDLKAAKSPDVYIGNSSEVSKRILKYYNRQSYTLFPSVESERFRVGSKSERRGFIVVGRQVPYKRVDLAIMACNLLGTKLTVVGSGSEHQKLLSIAGPSVEFIDAADDKALAELYAASQALIYPAEEDAGIVPLEAMAAGTPVIAFGRGGSLDTVVDGKTGLMFTNQTVDGLVQAINDFKGRTWDYNSISTHAQKYSKKNFQYKLKEIIDLEIAKNLEIAITAKT